MLESRTFSIPIARPVDEVYEFLLEPTNFARWAFVGSATMRHLGGLDWAVETTVGSRVLRFNTRNRYGVLDHFALLSEDDTPHPIPMRVVANEEGTELIYTSFRREAMSMEAWNSLVEWVTTDLLALKSLLDAHQE